MIKVLQVLGSLQRGGAETMIVNVYRNVDPSQVHFDFLVKDRVEIGYEQEVERLGANIYRVESAKKIGIFNYVKQQFDVMKNNGPYDAVHAHVNVLSGLTMLSAWLAGVKVRVVHSHNTQFKNSRAMVVIGKALLNIFSNRFVACGVDAGKALFGKKRFVVIPNAIEVDKFLYSSDENVKRLRAKLDMKESALQICHIGRFNDVKNHSFIIDVASDLSSKGVDFQLHLLGNGELFEEMKEKVKNLNLRDVFFHGSIPNANEYLIASDLFILPSKHEGLPVTLVEAQCSGIQCYIADNITKEVDFGLGLIKYIPLDLSTWVKEICAFKNENRSNNKERILQTIEERGYSVKRSA